MCGIIVKSNGTWSIVDQTAYNDHCDEPVIIIGNRIMVAQKMEHDVLCVISTFCYKFHIVLQCMRGLLLLLLLHLSCCVHFLPHGTQVVFKNAYIRSE